MKLGAPRTAPWRACLLSVAYSLVKLPPHDNRMTDHLRPRVLESIKSNPGIRLLELAELFPELPSHRLASITAELIRAGTIVESWGKCWPRDLNIWRPLVGIKERAVEGELGPKLNEGTPSRPRQITSGKNAELSADPRSAPSGFIAPPSRDRLMAGR